MTRPKIFTKLKKFKISLRLTRERLTYLAIAFLLASAGILAFWVLRPPTSSQTLETKIVTETENGFSPPTISVNIGQSVKFVTTRVKPFWPASDLHPTHNIYPEFDPKQPIDPKGSWTFRFDKPGRWNYHDHLAPEFTGVIVVTNQATSTESLSNKAQDCQSLAENQAVECWFNVVDASVRAQGVDATYDMVSNLYQTDAIFAKNCHAYTHRIGQIAYQFFSTKKDFTLGQKTAFCGYGFYHGFMETLLEKGGNYQQAKDFCEYAIVQLSATAKDAGMACYHGIGHGFSDYFDPAVYRNPSEIATKSLELCKKISDSDQKLFRCASGVFNSLALLMGYGKLPVNKDDPFYLCREQTGVIKDACYGDLEVLALDILSKQNFPQAARYVEAISDDQDASNAIEVMSSDRTKWVLDKSEYSAEVASCRSLQTRLIHPCVIGIAAGLMEFGKPDQEYVKAAKLCSSSFVAEDERDDCYKRVLNYSANIYTSEKLGQICADIDARYQRYCTKKS